MFMPEYQPADFDGDGFADTDCASTGTPKYVDFSTGQGASNLNVMFDNADKVTTEVVMKGCTVRITHTIEDLDGTKQQEVVGEALTIESTSAVSGPVSLTLFDAAGAAMCRGNYFAQFRKEANLLGAAAR